MISCVSVAMVARPTHCGIALAERIERAILSVRAWRSSSTLEMSRDLITGEAALCTANNVTTCGLRRPPQLDVADCDFKCANSEAVSSNKKSTGNRARLRRTCSFRRRVSTPYRAARVLSSITLWPRNILMRKRQHACLLAVFKCRRARTSQKAGYGTMDRESGRVAFGRALAEPVCRPLPLQCLRTPLSASHEERTLVC